MSIRFNPELGTELLHKIHSKNWKVVYEHRNHDTTQDFQPIEEIFRQVAETLECGPRYHIYPASIPFETFINGIIKETLNREELWLAQTPQAFRRDVLLRAHQQGEADGVDATDDAFLVERLGLTVAIVQGSSDNIKVTRPEDLHMGEAILTSKTPETCS